MTSLTLELSAEDRSGLESWVRSRTLQGGLVERARIVLAVAGGTGTSETARRLGVSRPTVIKWRDRYVASGLDGLFDDARAGRPKLVDDAGILAATLEPPPEALGVTHWSTRLLAPRLGVAPATVGRAWVRYGVKPWRRQTFKWATQPRYRCDR